MYKGKILIEVRKGGFVNKGAELMLSAVLERMKKEYPEAVFAMTPTVSEASGPYLKRAQSGFYQKAHIWRGGIQFGMLANLIPSKIRDMFGIVLNKEIDIVLDLAGFEYSDQWGPRSCEELAYSCKRWKKNGTKVIILPQAFGPFKSKSNAKSMQAALNNADKVFARDKTSYKFLVEVVGKRDNLKIAPDFTNLIEGIIPESHDYKTNQFCIVPNYRMIDKTDKQKADAYLPFMTKITKYAYENDLRPFILLHEGPDDLKLAEAIQDAVSSNIQILKESDPLKIKGIIGASTGTVGSRFHGLVSALSQGKPALATGWSHKYQMLFEEYGFPEGLLDVHMSDCELFRIMDLLIDDSSRSKITNVIKQNSKILKESTNMMWDDVISVLRA
jgi:polysaccharide pyruvyl transferase WcaK-like protein